MTLKEMTAVKINQDYCSRCSICYSVCPFEAIKKDPTGAFEVDMKKCEVCGLCYSACPVLAIDIMYYSYNGLADYVENIQKHTKSDMLVLTCRGNSPPPTAIDTILRKEGLFSPNYIALRLPCAGRIPTEFVFRILKSGIKKVVSIQCEDAYCRFKEGTKVGGRRMALGGAVLQEFGLSKNALRVIKYSRKVSYDTSKCVGCDKCIFICPYDAIEAEQFATPKILLEKCMGCGACALVCPHSAIQVEGFEFEDVLKKYENAARILKENGQFPVMLVFACQWSEYSAVDDPTSVLRELKGAVLLEIPCFKSLDPVHIMNALHNGFDGVVATVCPSDDCRLEKGKETAERNVKVLKDTLRKMKLIDRFEVLNVSPRNPGEFNAKLKEFAEKISKMPRLEMEAPQVCTRS